LREDFRGALPGLLVSAGGVTLFNEVMAVHERFRPVDCANAETEEPCRNRNTDKESVESSGAQITLDDREREVERKSGNAHEAGDQE
jgi:hypothetical protein